MYMDILFTKKHNKYIALAIIILGWVAIYSLDYFIFGRAPSF